MRPIHVGLATAALALGIPSIGADARAPQPDAESGYVVVTRDDPSAPAGCRPRAVARLIQESFAAFNRGDPEATSYFEFAAVEGGGWYSIGEGGIRRPRRHFVTRDLTELRRYFGDRHLHSDRMRLLEVSAGYEEKRGIVHLGYRVRRRADDLRQLGIRTTVADGKGAIDCEKGRIAVWSMAMRGGKTPVGHGRLCPRPRKRTSATIACAPRRHR